MVRLKNNTKGDWAMVYCSKCGKKNEEEARFCNKCGASLTGQPMEQRRHKEEECEKECGGKRRPSVWIYFWIIVLALIAFGIILSIFSRLSNAIFPHWIGNYYWDIIWMIIGLVVVIFILYAVTSSYRKH